jgi:hypothetical protein
MSYRVPVTITYLNDSGGPGESETFPAQRGAEGCMVDLEAHGVKVTPLENGDLGETRIIPWHRVYQISYPPLGRR